MSKKTIDPKSILIYRGKPLIRDKNTICYGSMADKYVLFLMILTEKTEGNETLPDKIIVQILSTDTSLPPHKRIERQAEKRGLYEAFDVGTVWLDRANASK